MLRVRTSAARAGTSQEKASHRKNAGLAYMPSNRTTKYQAPAAYLRHLYMVDDMVSARMVDTEQLNNSNAASLNSVIYAKK